MKQATNQSREKYLWHTYGITLAEYDAMLNQQKGLCAICGNPMRRVEVDHRHIKGYKKLPPQVKRLYARGLLCGGRYWGCNRRLGRIDDPIWLRKAASYLENQRTQRLLDGK